MATSTCPVDCTCHTGPHTPCSEPGGCGSTGCGREPTGSCPACRARDPEYGLVCEPCRRWFGVALASIPRLAEQARAELLPADDTARYLILTCVTCALAVKWTPDRSHAHHSDPDLDDPENEKAHTGWVERYRVDHTGGPAPSVAPDMIVTGGAGEAPVPLDLHLHDLLADVVRDGGRPIDVTGDNYVQALDTQPRTVWVDNGTKGKRQATVLDRKPARDTNGHKVMTPAGDQIGTVPIAQVLDQEVRAWIDAGAPGSRYRPTPTISELAAWLDKRLTWACDNYSDGGLDAFAAMLARVRGQLMSALGEFDPEPERCDGVECNRCFLRMLFRRQDGTGDVECQNPDCRKVFTAVQYREWTAHLGAFERAERTPTEVAELLHART